MRFDLGPVPTAAACSPRIRWISTIGRDCQVVSADLRRSHAPARGHDPRGGREVRRGLRELPPHPDACASRDAVAGLIRPVIGPGAEAKSMAGSGEGPEPSSQCPVHGLRGSIPAVRDGLRPPGWVVETGSGLAHDRPCGNASDLGGGRQVRYRLRELSSAPDVPTTVGPIGAGVAQLAERQPSKLDVAGSNPVSRSTLPSLVLAVSGRV